MPIARGLRHKLAGWLAYAFLSSAILLALLVRLAFVSLTQRIDSDGYFYLTYSRNILAGDWLHPAIGWTPYPLGYPLLVALISMLTGNLEQAGILASLLAGVLLLVPVWGIADLLDGRRTAFLATLLVALNSSLIFFSVRILSESLFALLAATLVWLWLRECDGQHFRGQHLLTIAVSLFLVFVRPIGLVLLAGGLLAHLLLLGNQRTIIIRSAVTLLIAAMLYLVYAQVVMTHLQTLTGSPQPAYELLALSHSLVNFTRNDAAAKLTLYQPPMSTLAFIAANWQVLIHLYVYRIAEQLAAGVGVSREGGLEVTFPFYLWPPAVLGVWLSSTKLRNSLIPLVVVLPLLFVLPFFLPSPRYYLALLPIFLAYSAVGIRAAANRIPNRLGQACLVAGILAISLAHTYQNNPRMPESRWSDQEAGLWLKTHEQPKQVLTLYPAVAYYAEADFQLLQAKPLAEQLPTIQRGNGSVLLVVDESMWQQITSTQPMNLAMPGVTLLYTSNSTSPVRLQVYLVGS